jgi:hypothetical protein
MKTIRHKDQIIAIIYRDSDWTEGLNFITPNDLFIQVGSWWYPKGKELDSHLHNEFDRKATRTQEMTYVKKGAMKVTLFTEDKSHLQEFMLYEGDLAVFAYGGHGFEILEDNTQIIEAKNGPFVNVVTDKTKF